MLSYKQWKSLNESILPSYNLGIANPQNIGLQLQNGFDLEEAKHAKKKKVEKEDSDGEIVKDKEPEVEVEVKKDKKSKKDKKCGKNCGKSCGKMCGKMSKKKMWSDEDDADDEDEEEYEDEEGEEEEGDEEVEGEDDSDEDEDEEGEEEEDGEEEDEDGEDEEESPKFSKKNSKKKMKKEKMKAEQAWWSSVNSMSGHDPDTKFNDGWTEYQSANLFTPIDQDSLSQAVRPEPGAGEVGYAPSGRIGSLPGQQLDEAKWNRDFHDDGVVLNDPETGRPRIFPTIKGANAVSEVEGGKAVKHGSGYIIIKYDVPQIKPGQGGYSSKELNILGRAGEPVGPLKQRR